MPFWKRKSTVGAPPAAQPQPAQQQQWQASIPMHTAGQQPAAQAAPAPNLFQQRGDEYFNAGDYSNAAFMYREALRSAHTANEQVPIQLQLGLTQTLSSPPDLNGALTTVAGAIANSPASGPAWRLKGDIHERQENFHEAVNAYSQAVPLLSGYDKVQASQSLANARAKCGVSSPTTNTPTTTYSPPAAQISYVGSSVSPAASSAAPAGPPPTSMLNVQPQSQQRAPSPIAAAAQAVVSPEVPSEAPPSYTSAGPAVSGSRIDAVTTAMGMNAGDSTTWNDWLTAQKQGGMYIKALTAVDGIDTPMAMFYGKDLNQSVTLDIAPAPTGHVSWKTYYASSISDPGTTFIDYDCETASSYDGRHAGTVSVLGYSEEYRLYQQEVKPPIRIQLQSETTPKQGLTQEFLVNRITQLQNNPTLEDNEGLWDILGLPPAANATTTSCIQDICMSLASGKSKQPNRFPDFLLTESFSQHIFGSTTGVGFTNFLLNIVLGMELHNRLKKMGSSVKYTSYMSNGISAVVIIAKLWMQDVTLRKNPASGNYIVGSRAWTIQEEGLIHFAEAIGWPYMDEAREKINGMFNRMATNPEEVPDYLSDWLHGLVIPGKFFRHRIMTCLVLACPTTKKHGSAAFFGNGFVVAGKMWWPKRTAVGRVLAGLNNMRVTMGWVGPIPVAADTEPGWYRLDSKELNFVTPVVEDPTKTALEFLGFDETDVQRDPDALVRIMCDRTKWTPPRSIPRRPDAEKASLRKAVTLDKVRLEPKPAATGPPYSRPVLDFTCHGQKVTYTIYSNPVFVAVPKCEGTTHPIHERQVEKLFANVVHVKRLKDSNTLLPPRSELLIIDATEPDEEAVARAWCAEVNRHAVVKKGGIGCFTCAVNLATSRTGLGFNVLIWVS